MRYLFLLILFVTNVNAAVTVNLKAFLQGPYDSTSGLMTDSLRTLNFIPLTNPYSGSTAVTASQLTTTGSNAVVDWILIELRSQSNSTNIVASQPALILRNGNIVSASGAASISINVANDYYFVSLKHRNHLPVMTKFANYLTSTSTTIDFSSLSTQLHSNTAVKTIGTINAIVNGDVNADGKISYTGTNNDRDPILVRIGGSVPTAIVNGYYPEDVNMDGTVKYTGTNNDRDLILVAIGGTVPTNIVQSGMPCYSCSPDNVAPSVPTNITAASITQTSATINWTASTDNTGVTGYDVSVNGGAAVSVTTNSYNMTSLTAGTTYNVTVRSKDAAGNISSYSQPTTFSTQSVPVVSNSCTISAPTEGSSQNGSFTLTVNHTQASSNDLYKISVTGYPQGTGNISTFVSAYDPAPSATSSSFNITLPAGLAAGSTYVMSVGCEFNPPWSRIIASRNIIITSTPDTQAPTVPTNLASSNVSSTTFNLSWTASTDNVGVTSYKISEATNKFSEITVTSGTTASLSGLTASTVYSVRVKACDSALNCSANTANLNVTTTAPVVDTQAPTVPVGLTANPSQTTAALSWTASTDNIGVTGYDVSINSGAAVSVSGTSYTATSLNPNTTYNFKVRAKDANGNLSAYSVATNFTTLNQVPTVASYYSSKVTAQLSASVQTSPASITIQWANVTGRTVSSVAIYRKTLSATSWGTAIANPSATLNSWTDSSVSLGSLYEYKVQLGTSSGTAYGYIVSGVNADIDQYQGKIAVLVDSSIQSQIQTELNTLTKDLYGDGWIPIVLPISRTDSPASVRTQLINLRAANTDLKAVYNIGHIPVAYAGNNNPDGHGGRAMGSDGYLGELTSTWNGSSGCSTSPYQATLNDTPNSSNTMCNATFPSTLELQVGRVDMFNLPTFAFSEVDLLKNYLNKVHNFKTKQLVPNKRAFIKDFFNSNGWTNAAGMWSTFPSLVGVANFTIDNGNATKSADLLHNQSYLFTYNTYYGADCKGSVDSVIGSTLSVSQKNWGGVFNLVWGSYFGEFNCSDSFLRGLLASGNALSNVYNSHNWYFHHMGMGMNIGYSAVSSMNNESTQLYLPTRQTVAGATANTYEGLMGDPTLRMEYIAPPSALSVSNNAGKVALSWTASTESGIAGYHVYQVSASGITKLTSTPVTTTTYSSNVNYASGITFVVRAIKLNTGMSGSYNNPSIGAVATTN